MTKHRQQSTRVRAEVIAPTWSQLVLLCYTLRWSRLTEDTREPNSGHESPGSPTLSQAHTAGPVSGL